MYFDIEFDGRIVLERFKVGGGRTRRYSTVIQDIDPSMVNHHKLCSISVPESGQFLRTRICTEIKLLYPKEQVQTLLSEHYEK